MHPILFQFESLHRVWTISSYEACFVFAGIVLLIASMLIAPRRGERRGRLLVCLAAAIPFLFIGARLLFAVTNRTVYEKNPGRLAVLALSDFSLLGGLILAAIVIVTIRRAQRRDPWIIADVVAPGAAAAIAILKVGCFLNGCCFGERSDLPWAVTFPRGSLAHFHQMSGRPALILLGPQPVHPVQLYEASAALIAAACAGWLIVKKAPAGIPFLAAAMVYSAGRLLLSPLRSIDSIFTAPQGLFPLIYSLVIATCAAQLLIVARRAAIPGAAATAPSYLTTITRNLVVLLFIRTFLN